MIDSNIRKIRKGDLINHFRAVFLVKENPQFDRDFYKGTDTKSFFLKVQRVDSQEQRQTFSDNANIFLDSVSEIRGTYKLPIKVIKKAPDQIS